MPPAPIGHLRYEQIVELIMRCSLAKKCARRAVTQVESLATVVDGGKVILAPGAVKVQAGTGNGYASQDALSGRPGNALSDLRNRNRGVENIPVLLQRS